LGSRTWGVQEDKPHPGMLESGEVLKFTYSKEGKKNLVQLRGCKPQKSKKGKDIAEGRQQSEEVQHGFKKGKFRKLPTGVTLVQTEKIVI